MRLPLPPPGSNRPACCSTALVAVSERPLACKDIPHILSPFLCKGGSHPPMDSSRRLASSAPASSPWASLGPRAAFCAPIGYGYDCCGLAASSAGAAACAQWAEMGGGGSRSTSAPERGGEETEGGHDVHPVSWQAPTRVDLGEWAMVLWWSPLLHGMDKVRSQKDAVCEVGSSALGAVGAQSP